MPILGTGQQTYLFINGLSVSRPVRLADNIKLLPAHCSHYSDDLVSVFKSEVDVGVGALFLRRVSSQVHVTADDPKELVVAAWNAQWDIILLSAFAQCEAVCNFQCDSPAEAFGPQSQLSITNYHLRGFAEAPRVLTEDEAQWIELHFSAARNLLDREPFRNGVHMLWSFRWHTMPAAQLALLWAGIEGLFQIESELSFRVGLYASRFLWPDDLDSRRAVFVQTRKLYRQRSAAVHGGPIKGDSKHAIEESASLLLALLRRCVVVDALPDPDALAP